MVSIKNTAPAHLPHRVWFGWILGGLWILAVIWIGEALIRPRAWNWLLDGGVVTATFLVLHWVLRREFRRAEQAQAASRTQQEQLSLVVEGSNDGFWDWNIATGEATYSGRWAGMLGYALEEVPRQVHFWHEIIHPDDKARAIDLLQSHLDGRTPMYECELRLRTKTGGWKWVLDRGKVVERDRDGKPLRAAGTHTDITARKAAEEALQQSEQKWRLLVKHIPQCIFVKDLAGVFTSISDNFAGQIGRRPEDILDQTDFDFCPRELAERYRADDQEVIATGQPKEVEEPYEAQGERRWARTIKVPYHDSDGRVTGVLGFFTDITERKRAEESLIHSETQLRLVWESALEAMRLTDRQGTLLRVNEAYCRLVGRKREELEGQPLGTLFPEAQRAAILREHEEWFAAGGSPVPFEREVELAGGKRLNVEVSYSLLRLPGQPDLALAVLRDISERRQAEQARRLSEERHRTLFEATTDALFVHELLENGIPGRYIEVNDVACERLGYSREELLQKTPRDILLPAVGHDTAWIGKRLREGFTPRFEQVHLTKDGRRIPVEVHARLFELQGRPAVISLARDITERQRAEEALRASEARLIEALQIARLGHWEHDLAQDRITFSDQVLDLLQTSARREGGYSMAMADFVRQFIHAEDAPRVGTHLQRAIANPQTQTQDEFRLVRRDGQVRWCLVRLKALQDSEGRVVKLVGSAQDIAERKQAEQELERQSAFRSAVVQHAAEGICVCHEVPEPGSVCFTVWNDRMTQITGYTADEINQRGWYQTLYADPQVQAWARQRMREMRVGEDSVNEEWEITRADGEKRVVSMSTSVLPQMGGPRQVLAVIQDITERKRVDTQLRLQQSALEAAANGILITDRGGKIIWVNDAFTTLTGYCRWEVIGQYPRLLKSGKHDRDFYRHLWSTITAGNVWQGELLNRRKDGSVYHEDMTITPVRDAAGQIAHFIAIKQDVSARRKLEQQREEQARLLDLAQDAIFVRDLNDRIRYWNAGAERLYGWTREEATAHAAAELLHRDLTSFETANAQLLAQGHWEGELPQVRKDGTPVVVFCRWTLVRDEHGVPKAVLVINTDITARRTLEAQILRAQRLEGIGQLAGGVAHDLNNILTPVLIAAQMLKADSVDDRKRQLLDRIERNAKRGADILRQLLTFARGMQGERLPVSPKRLVHDIVKIAAETFPRNLQITSAVPDEISPIVGDPTQLHQVLLNLCVNARDAMPNGGALTLTVEETQVDKAVTQVNPEAKAGRFVVIAVADTGCGMPAAVMDHVFEPFFTTKPHGQGTGLGLATVRGIVKTHGGFIEVKTELNVGTCFRVFLPASQQPLPLAAAKPLPAARGRGELILVVDDEEFVRAVAKAALEKHGYRVITATDGRDAVTLFVQQQPNVAAVMVDVDMPHMDGLALSDALLKLRPDLRIMVMTGGFSSEAKETKFRNLGVDHFLRKPFTTEELLKFLREIIERPLPVRAPAAAGN